MTLDPHRGFSFNGTVLVEFLKQRGYQIIVANTWYSPTNMTDADSVVAPHTSKKPTVTQFHIALTHNTMLRTVQTYLHSLNSVHYHRSYVITTFDALTRSRPADKPKFFYAHVMLPHYPYVADSTGGIPSIQKFPPFSVSAQLSGIRNQVHYCNERLQDAITQMKANYKGSTRDLVIIVLSDHGVRSSMDSPDFFSAPIDTGLVLDDTLGNLAAFYMPKGRDLLYSTITPVNIFRILLRASFGVDAELTSDRSISSIRSVHNQNRGFVELLGDTARFYDRHGVKKRVYYYR